MDKIAGYGNKILEKPADEGSIPSGPILGIEHGLFLYTKGKIF